MAMATVVVEREAVQTLHKTADHLGRLKARMAALKEQEKELRAILLASGEDEIEGNLFRVTISTHEVEKIDYKTIVTRLEPSHQMLSAHTTYQNRTVVKVSARKT